jgi:hypothetical protein
MSQRVKPRRAMKRCSTRLCEKVAAALAALAANFLRWRKSCQPRRQ